jgi:hypothetical protein
MHNAERLTELLLEYADQNGIVTPENRGDVFSSAMRMASYLSEHGAMVIHSAIVFPPRTPQGQESFTSTERTVLDRHAA